MSERIDQRYLYCRLALDYLSRHGRPPRKAHVQWERIFNALHRTHSPSTIRAIDGLLHGLSRLGDVGDPGQRAPLQRPAGGGIVERAHDVQRQGLSLGGHGRATGRAVLSFSDGRDGADHRMRDLRRDDEKSWRIRHRPPGSGLQRRYCCRVDTSRKYAFASWDCHFGSPAVQRKHSSLDVRFLLTAKSGWKAKCAWT